MGYWNPEIKGFQPHQNAEETLLAYSQKQIDEYMQQLANGGMLDNGEDGKPIVVSRPQPTAVEKQAQYESKVDSLIRTKYTLSQELAILRQQESKSEEYQAYFAYCEECKAKARQEVYGDEI